MYCQLGNLVFQGLFGFDSYESKDATTYAQHDLLNAKPVLQPTGNELEELTIGLTLRADFVNPATALQQLKASKDKYEVLPLIKGNGQYLGDFVILEISKAETQALADGTVIEATVTITLKEYLSSDKLQQQQSAARKAAFATGDKKPLNVAAKQLPTVPQITAEDLTIAASHANIVDQKVSDYQNNVSARERISHTIQQSLKKMDDQLSTFNDRLKNIPVLKTAQDIMSSTSSVRSVIQQFTFPVKSIDDLVGNNLDLQKAMRALNTGSTELINLVITREA